MAGPFVAGPTCAAAVGGLWVYRSFAGAGLGSLALYYNAGPWLGLRLALALGFLAFGGWALFRARWPRGYAAFAVVFVLMLYWWSTILPSHDRPWRREVAVLPRATIDGDKVRITGVRHFKYTDRDNFTEHYEEREVELSHLVAVDLYVSYWTVGPVGHTFLSFIFDNAPPVCISIETRPEVGEGFAPSRRCSNN